MYLLGNIMWILRCLKWFFVFLWYVLVESYHFGRWIFHYFSRKRKLTSPRSSQWPRVRREHLLKEPVCQVCGGNQMLNVHHIVPVHIDHNKELDPNNLITLCEGTHHLNCHLLFGHLQDWHSYNKDILKDVKIWAEKIKTRPYVQKVVDE